MFAFIFAAGVVWTLFCITILVIYRDEYQGWARGLGGIGAWIGLITVLSFIAGFMFG